MRAIAVRGLGKRFGDVVALDGIDFVRVTNVEAIVMKQERERRPVHT